MNSSICFFLLLNSYNQVFYGHFIWKISIDISADKLRAKCPTCNPTGNLPYPSRTSLVQDELDTSGEDQDRNLTRNLVDKQVP